MLDKKTNKQKIIFQYILKIREMFFYPKIARVEIFHLQIILNLSQITNLGT